MFEDVATWIGAGAAVLSSLSYIPQVRKAWPRGSTKDLSLGMLFVLTTGLLLWIVYGLLRADWVIVAARFETFSWFLQNKHSLCAPADQSPVILPSRETACGGGVLGSGQEKPSRP